MTCCACSIETFSGESFVRPIRFRIAPDVEALTMSVSATVRHTCRIVTWEVRQRRGDAKEG